MMKKKKILKTFLPVLAFFVVLTSCQKPKTQDAPIYLKKYKKEILESRKDLVTRLFTSSIPGMSICVSVDGKIVWSEGLGVASKELEAPTTRETKFRIGNTSQILTAYLIAKLQEQGKLDVDKSFYTYIPNFPKKNYDFSLRNLGTHTSGFADMPTDEILNHNKLKNLKGYIKAFDADTLLCEPNKFTIDSEYNFGLLGILAETVEKDNFTKLVDEQILDTLNIENTVVDYPQIIIPNRSETYYRDYIARLIKAPEVNLFPFAPTLGYLSTADDLNRLAQQILAPGFFTRESLDLFYNQQKLSSGEEILRSFGWISTKDRYNRKLIAKLGSTIGGSSAIAVFPDQKLVVTMCSNLGDDTDELPVLKVADRFLERLDPIEEPQPENKSKSDNESNKK